MAQLLIYNGPHAWDKLNLSEVDAKIAADPKFLSKYDSRLCTGDIGEVFPDSRKRTGCGKHCVLIKVPDLSYEDAKAYCKLSFRFLTESEKEIERQKFVAPAPTKEEKDKALKELREGTHRYCKCLDKKKVVLAKKRFRINTTLLLGVKGGEIITANIAQLGITDKEK